jgi:ATP-dependent Clp protease protease subunit
MYSLKKRLNKILAHHTGKSIEEIERDSDRDNYMPAQVAAEYGLIDKVLEKKPVEKKD